MPADCVHNSAKYVPGTHTPSLYIDTVSKNSSNLLSQLLLWTKTNPQAVLIPGYSDTNGAETGIPSTRIDRTVFLKLGYALLM